MKAQSHSFSVISYLSNLIQLQKPGFDMSRHIYFAIKYNAYEKNISTNGMSLMRFLCNRLIPLQIKLSVQSVYMPVLTCCNCL